MSTKAWVFHYESLGYEEVEVESADNTYIELAGGRKLSSTYTTIFYNEAEAKTEAKRRVRENKINKQERKKNDPRRFGDK